MLPYDQQKGKLQDEKHIKFYRARDLQSMGVVTMLAHYILRGSALFCNSLHFHEHDKSLVQVCGNSGVLAMRSCTKQSMYCYPKPVLTSWDDTHTNGRGQFLQVYVKKYVAWPLCTSQGSHVHTLFLICPCGISNKNGKITVITSISANFNCCKYRSHPTGTVLILQVPFSGLYFWWAGTFSSNSHYRSI